MRPTVAAAERVLGLTPAPRRRTVRRLDGGCGTDANLNWALWHGSQVLGKGYNGRWANAYARAVSRREELSPGERWIAPAPTPRHYYRRTQTAVLKWKTEQGQYGHSLLTTSLREDSLGELVERDDDRAAIAAECNADTGGRQRPRRRQPRLAAQAALVWLTDVAHNLLAWSRGWLFRHSPVAEAGIYRMVKELYPIPCQSPAVNAQGSSAIMHNQSPAILCGMIVGILLNGLLASLTMFTETRDAIHAITAVSSGCQYLHVSTVPAVSGNHHETSFGGMARPPGLARSPKIVQPPLGAVTVGQHEGGKPVANRTGQCCMLPDRATSSS